MTIETRPAEVVSAPKVKTIADVLRHAAWIIEEHGWFGEGPEENEENRYCAYLAIGQDGDPLALVEVAQRVFRDYVGRSIIAWNDTPGRTAAEVTAALRAAADASERAS